MTKVLLLSLASALVTAQQPQFIQQSDFNQQDNFNTPRDPNVSFNYGYEINNKDTGDAKTHQEALENGVLRGSYSVVQPDGNRRIVEYEADEVSGFQAKVRYEPGYPIQTPPQRRPSAGGLPSSQGSKFSAGGSASSQGSRFSTGSSSSQSSSSGSSSRGSFVRGSRPNRPSQASRFPGSPQSSKFTGGVPAQQPRFPAGTSQGLIFGPPGPTSQGTPTRFIGSPPPQFQESRTSPQFPGQNSLSGFAGPVIQTRPSGSAGVSASQGSQYRPAGFPGTPAGSSTIDASRAAGHLSRLSAGINSSRRPQGGAQGSEFSSQSSSQPGSVSSQNTISLRPSQIRQPSSVFSGPGPLPQIISTRPILQAGSPPSAPRLVSSGSPRPDASVIRRPGAPFPSQPNAQNDVAVKIASNGFFSQFGTSSSSASAAQAGSAGASFEEINGAPSQAGNRGASFGVASQSGFSGAAFQQDRSLSRFQSGAPSVSLQSSNAFQSGQGSRFQGGPAFDQLISSSLLVTDENLDNIEAVELASAGFDESSYAYRLVPVPVNNKTL